MKQLLVPFLTKLNKTSPMREVSDVLNKLEKSQVAVTPWAEFAYKPHVSFAMGHNSDCLFLKFFVQENSVRALFRRDNDPVYKDSCVEFFISLNQEVTYYNLEFNSLGTCRVGYGSDKDNRTIISESLLKSIKRSASLNILPKPEGKPEVNWELTLIIPALIFAFHNIKNLDSQRCRVNFFKCGDDLPNPHYVTWSPVEAEEPNFHLPEFFGEMHFLQNL